MEDIYCFMNRSFNNLIIYYLTSIAMIFLVSALVGCKVNKNKNELSASKIFENRVLELIQNKSAISAEIYKQNKHVSNKFIYLDSIKTGVNFKNNWMPEKKYETQLENSFISAGVAIGDYNDDGLLDIFLSRQQDGGRLFKNLGQMRFEDVTLSLGILDDEVWSTGASFIDINNDGLLDLFVCMFDSPNKLFINYGSHFKNEAELYGLDYSGASVMMAFSDYDNDGDLDAYLLTNRLIMNNDSLMVKVLRGDDGSLKVHPDYSELGYFIKRPGMVPAMINAGEYDYLYQNDNGRFVDVSEKSGIGKNPYYGLSATWWDFNDDGKTDLYVANDFMGPDHLFQNMGLDSTGSIQFKDVTEEILPYTPWFSMGADFSDINNDGKLDLMTSDMAGSNHYRDKVSMGAMTGPDSEAWFLNFPTPPQYMRNMLYLNSGTNRFNEIAYLAGLATTDWTWSVKFGDLDNDGYEDVYFTNGMSRDFGNGDVKDLFRNQKSKTVNNFDFWINQEPYRLKNMVFKNLGDFKFDDVSNDWGLDYLGVNTGSAIGDLDNDGDLDIVMNAFDEPARIYQNNLKRSNSLRIKLDGKDSNSDGFGTKLELFYDNGRKKIVRAVSSSRGLMSSSESIVHFGLGSLEIADSIKIYWPSGSVQKLKDVPCGYLYTVSEKDNSSNLKLKHNSIFVEHKNAISKIKHSERIYDDFKREKLLPNKLSQLGSGVSWGDVDGDGDDDLFLGGAAGSYGRIFINDGFGDFQIKPQPVLMRDASYEDMGSVFIDPDNDGDLDLYVVSGGVECEAGDPILQDRIYLNNGKGDFIRGASTLLPRMFDSGGVITASDIDKDGRLDLFIGGRVVPGKYPEFPRSYILKNSGPKFIDVTENIAPNLKNSGMVTSAIFCDVNGDSWDDLLITYEWGPVRYYQNDNGKFFDRTIESGLNDRLGWFNSISAGDIDNDGDIDFVIGNFGFNTKYKATLKKPELLYYGDFEGAGKKNIVEAKYENNICLPRRGLSCSSNAMPIVKDKFPTYHDFAISSVQDIYTEALLSSADKLIVNELASGVLINEQNIGGEVVFKFYPLPRIVQVSPVFGSSLCDVNGDGNIDLFVVQNFSGPQRETGYMHGGIGQLLLGDGKGFFQPISADISGIKISGDATTLTSHDFNGDGMVDFLVGVNDDNYKLFINQGEKRTLKIRLPDYPKGRNFAGSKIKIHYNDGSVQLHQSIIGGGYLSQSAPIIFVGDKANVKKIIVKWSDGLESELNIEPILTRFSYSN